MGVDMSKEIPTKDYMVDGWDRSPHLSVHPYKRGSRHNRIGMSIMWTYYILIVGIICRLIWVLNT